MIIVKIEEKEGVRVTAQPLVYGEKGDPFTRQDFTPEDWEALKFKREDFTPEDIAMLKKPALDAATVAEGATQNANTAAQNADDKAALAAQATTNANQAAANANTLAPRVTALEDMTITNNAAIKNFENTISAANIAQTAQTSVSGYEILSLPKTAGNGGMEVKLEGLTATNLLVNGNFKNGTTGWASQLGAVLSIDNGRLKVALSERTYSAARFSNGVATIVGNKYYKYVEISHDSPVAQSLNHQLFSADIFTLNPETILFRSRIETAVANSTSNFIGKYAQTDAFSIFVKRIALIDLTTAFGAGNEPDLATCDKMFASYFEGVKSMQPSGRVRSVGKNLFPMPTRDYFGDETRNPMYVSGVFKPKTQYFLSAKAYWTSNFAAYLIFLYSDGTFSQSTVFSKNTPETRTLVSEIGKSVVKAGLVLNPGGINEGRVDVNSIILTEGTAAIPYEPYKSTELYLTAPELKSNGTVKDEIRKGVNGYELIKRVGVGTVGSEKIANGNFDSATGWSIVGTGTVIENGVAKIIGPASSAGWIQQSGLSFTAGKLYKITLRITKLIGPFYVNIGNTTAYTLNSNKDSAGTFVIYHSPKANQSYFQIIKEHSSVVDLEIDSVSVMEYHTLEGAADSSIATEYGNNIHYTLANPVITPIQHAGTLQSFENGAIYKEPVIADAGMYTTKFDILNTDYPISAIEKIVKYADKDTYLDPALAVIAGNKLSFTHPGLTNGDLVLVTYAFSKEDVEGRITATYYDSRYVIADTTNGKFYKWKVISTNGVSSLQLTEV